MKTIFIKNLSQEEKKRFDIAKAKSDQDTWRDFFLTLLEEHEGKR